jgi:hypothetical protein
MRALAPLMVPTRKTEWRRRASIWVLLGPDMGFGMGRCGPDGLARRDGDLILLEPGGLVVSCCCSPFRLEVDLGAFLPCWELVEH